MPVHHKQLLIFLLPVIGGLFSCYGKRQIMIDQSLAGNSERWTARVKHGIGGTRNVGFGPFATGNISKLDSPVYKTSSVKYFQWNLPPSDSVRKRKVYEIRLALEADTAEVISFVWTTSK